ncbi:MAG: serine/threonine protein kinase [Muribaculaceae bacterium]|nr:serine/threonine protein kinase [Muribaculaceae bacterium]
MDSKGLSMVQLQSNETLQSGKYRILRVLGQGGFGITYLAEHTMLDKLVAIKEFFPKEYCDRNESNRNLTIGTKNSVEIVDMLKAKFIKEAKNISKLNHRNIITIYDIFQENDTAYYVMEYVEGSSLSQLVKESGALSEAQAIGYIRKVGDAVGYMHSLSMNHLDLKPANIMVRQKDDEPILIDFGLSKQYDASGGQTSTTPIGISHGFAPIEQYRPGGVSTFTPQTDIYALGATLYNLLSGQVPPHYSEILEDGLPELPVSVSQQSVDAITHAMEIKKNRRPVSVAEFIDELGRGANSSVGPESPAEAPTAAGVSAHMSAKENVPPVSAASTLESTMMIGNMPIQPNRATIDNSEIINGVEFVDLGLSVKWANSNIGAGQPTDVGQFFSRKDSNSLVDLYQWNMHGAIVPSISHFEELIKLCKWYWGEVNGTLAYTVVGPNGNSICLPVTGDGVTYPGRSLVTFGLLWTNEALLNQWRSHSNLLYFNSSQCCVVTYYTDKIDKNCPIRLVCG